MLPGASISSDVIHSSFLYGCLIIPTALVSMLRGSISRFFSKLLEIPRRNIGVEVHDQPHGNVTLHTIYGYLTGLLLTLIALKYEGSGTNAFREHPTLMMFFLIAISVYGFSLIKTLSRSNEHSVKTLMVVVSHIFGVLACECLLLALVSPIHSVFINLPVPTLTVILALCKKYDLLHPQETEEQASHVPDLEAPAIL